MDYHLTIPSITLAVTVMLGAFALTSRAPEKQVEADPVFSREVVAYEILPATEGEEVTVKYEYLGERLPEKLTPDEVVEKRTETSFTRELDAGSAGTNDIQRTYQAIVYSQETFAKEGDTWYYIEHATTTETAFNRKREGNALASLFWETAHADSISPFAGAGDGYIASTGSVDENEGGLDDEAFAMAHDDTTGSTATPTATTAIVNVQRTVLSFTIITYTINRAFLPFDTSSIPASATVIAADLNVWVVSTANAFGGSISTVQTSQATHTTLTTADYDAITSSPGSSAPLISALTTSAYNTFSLTPTGLGWIKKSGEASACSATTGITCLGMRQSHDYNNSAPGVTGQSRMTISTSENTGTTQDPFLTVTYSTGSFAFWQFQDF